MLVSAKHQSRGQHTHPLGSMSAMPAPASAVGFQVVTLIGDGMSTKMV